MTTFTTEDKEEAYRKKVEEAPYQPGYEDAVVTVEPIPFAGMVDLNKPEMSRQEIADALGTSRQTITNIEEKAIKKIRAELFKRGIEKEDLL